MIQYYKEVNHRQYLSRPIFVKSTFYRAFIKKRAVVESHLFLIKRHTSFELKYSTVVSYIG